MAKIGTVMTLPEPAKLLELPIETATLVNITNVKLPIKMFTYGNYTLPYCVEGFRTMREADGTEKKWPCERGEEYAAMKIKAARGTIDFGEKRRQEFAILASEIVLDIARQGNGDLWGIGHDVTGQVGDETARGFAGLFLADGEEPTEQELAEMRHLLHLSDAALVQEGHKTWDQFGKPDYIHEGFKRAARRIGVEADWLYTILNVPNCPHCGSKLKSATATVCAACQRDIVTPKAAANGVAMPAEEKKTTPTHKERSRQNASL